MIKERLTPGALIDQGRFEVKRAIKAGGMGAVYEVVDHRLGGKTFALKEMINPGVDMDGQQQSRERFISEVQVMMKLDHPNIPRVTHQFMHGKSFYFVMELVNGIDLGQRLKEQGNPGLPAEQVVGWALQVLDALQYLHGRVPPVVHRDIKPSNLLLCEEHGRVVLVDFGISCVTNPGEGLWIGTPGYAGAEQQFGRPEPRSDLFALGATMHQLISGVKPKDFDFPGFDELGLKVDPELEKIIASATVTWPQDRIPSAAAMSSALKKLKNIDVQVPVFNSAADFHSACRSYKEEVLDPELKALISRYGNECHTRFLPPNLDYLQFVLASPTPVELQVIKDEDRGVVRFRQKQGILDARPLGDVDPQQPDRAEKTREVIQRYLQEYEDSKSSGGGLLF
jgi:serine/threonine protein kinase